MSTVAIDSRHVVSRDGKPIRGKVTVRQVLETPARREGVYYACIIDPETGELVDRVPIYEAEAGECVDLVVEFEVTKVHPSYPKVGK